MMTPSRNLRHIAKPSLMVLPNAGGGGGVGGDNKYVFDVYNLIYNAKGILKSCLFVFGQTLVRPHPVCSFEDFVSASPPCKLINR